MFRNKIVLLQFLSLKNPKTISTGKLTLKDFVFSFFFAVVHTKSTLSVKFSDIHVKTNTLNVLFHFCLW